ncbi:glycosyltransferase family 4 protein [Oryzobacter telluris]|uniref:glycosyltransferase family 4 protein n=1 Tax=Oryzobacter telluris TaxID=3149179 RepID=UPI00370D1E3E
MLVVYQHLPHYRRDVFRALQSTPGWDVHFAAGTSSRDPGIATMRHSDLDTAHELTNVWIGPFLWQRGLWRLLGDDWDHVIFLGDVAYLSTWVGAARRRLSGTAVSFWTIGWHHAETGVRRWVRGAFYRLANQLLLYGQHARQIGIQAGYPSQRMTVVHNSSSDPPDHLEEDDERLEQIRLSLGGLKHPAIGAVIRLASHKRLDLLLQAAARSGSTSGRNVSVVLAGDGPEMANLSRQARALGVDLLLLGPIYGRRALELFYDACLVTVVPSLAGLTTIQSLKHGRPVVTHDDPDLQAPEFEAIEPGLTGAFYRKDDVADLARTVDHWILRVQRDPAGIAEHCQAVIIQEWSPNATARLIMTAVDSLGHPEGAGGARVEREA